MKPQEPQQSGKQIVSKREHAKRAGVKYFTIAWGTVCGLVLVYLTVNLWHLLVSKPEGIPLWPIVFLFVIVTALYGSGLYLVVRILKTATKIDTGVPLTRANTADLPEPDSLVRASEEPAQEPQAILLRAVTASEQTLQEQLVRPMGGQD